MLTLSQMCICNFIQGNGAFYLVNFYYNFRERVREVSGSVCICRDPTLLTFLLFCCVLNIFWGSPYILGRIVINIYTCILFVSWYWCSTATGWLWNQWKLLLKLHTRLGLPLSVPSNYPFTTHSLPPLLLSLWCLHSSPSSTLFQPLLSSNFIVCAVLQLQLILKPPGICKIYLPPIHIPL